MSSNTLYDAIALVRAGKNEEARQILFDIIRNDSQNEMAWMWLAETLTSDIDRMRVLKACANINPESKIAKMAITKLQEKFNSHEANLPSEAPFLEDATYNPNMPERTGHTGAIIGFDGSFILSNVADFDEVVDLRSDSDEPETPAGQPLYASANPFVEEEAPASQEAEASAEEQPGDAQTEFAQPESAQTENAKPEDEPTEREQTSAAYDVPTTPIRHSYWENEELEFEPDLSNYLQEQKVDNIQDPTFVSSNRVPLYRQRDQQEDPNNLEDLSIEELGFEVDEPGSAKTVYPAANQQPYSDLLEGDLVEAHVIKNNYEENAKQRKKRERNLVTLLIVGIFLVIVALCAVLYFVLNGGSFTMNRGAAVPTAVVAATETVAPSATPSPTPTITNTPQPTFTPTQTATATALVEVSLNAISVVNGNSLTVKLEQPLATEFFSNLAGDQLAIVDGKIISVWNAVSGEKELTLTGHNDLVTDVVFSGDGKYLVSGARDFSIILWDLNSGQALKTFGMDAETINRIYGDKTKNYPADVSVDYSPDGSTLAAGAFGVVNILDISSGLVRGTFSLSDDALQAAAQDKTNISGFKVKFNENGWVLSAAMSKNLVGLDSLDAAPLYQYELGAKGRVSYLADRIQMVEEDSGGITIRNLVDGAVHNGFGGRKVKPNDAPPSFTLSDDGSLLGIESDAIENEFELAVWDVKNDSSLMNFKGICADNRCEIPAFAFFPDGEKIIVSRQANDSSIEVIIVNLLSHGILLRMDGLENGVNSLAVSPTGSLAVGLDGSGRLHVWDTENGSEVLVVQTGSQEFVAFSRDGRLIYTWNSTSISVWGNP